MVKEALQSQASSERRDFRHSEAPAEESLFNLLREEVVVVLALASYKYGWWFGFSSSLTG